MIEQKFAGAGGASFVNPYHGNSEQLYTPVDYSNLAKDLSKLASTTYTAIQNNAFRQGQIDQLANAVDTDRWLGKDSYLKGALYSKAQVDMQNLNGEVLDIVNRGVANGQSSEQILEAIRAKQDSMVETANKLRDTNPEAADNIINGLTAQQGQALKKQSELLIHLDHNNRMSGDTMAVNRVLSDYIVARSQDGDAPMSDTTGLIGTFMGVSKLLRENATVMGMDENKYTDYQLTNGVKALLVNANMSDPNTMAFVNSLDKAMVPLLASGAMSSDSVASIRLLAQQKITESHSVLESQAMLLTDPSNPYTEGDEQAWNNLASTMRRLGVNETVITGYTLKMNAKRAKLANAALKAHNPASQLPAKGSSDYSTAKKAIVDDAVARYEASAGASATVSGRDFAVGDALLSHQGYDEAGEYFKQVVDRTFAGIDVGGESFDLRSYGTLQELYTRITNTDAPMMRYAMDQAMTPRQKMFVRTEVPKYLSNVNAIIDNDTMSPADKKIELQKLATNLHNSWANSSLYPAGSLGAGSGGSGKGYSTNNIQIQDAFNVFNIPGTNIGVGKLGVGKETGELILSQISPYLDDIQRTVNASGTILTKDNMYDACVSTKVFNHTSGGYAVISPAGDAYVSDFQSKKIKFNPNAMDSTLDYFARTRYLENGHDKTEYSTNDVALIWNPEHRQWIKVNASGGLNNYEIIPTNVFNRVYMEHLQKEETKAQNLVKDTVIASVPAETQLAQMPPNKMTAFEDADYLDKESDDDAKVSIVDVVQDTDVYKAAVAFLNEMEARHQKRFKTPVPEDLGRDAMMKIIEEGKAWFEKEIVDRGVDLAHDAYDILQEKGEAMAFVGAHIKARMYSALYGANGTYFSKLTPEEKAIVERIMSNEPMSPEWQGQANRLIRQSAISAINFIERAMQPAYGTSLTPVITSDGMGGKNTFWITNSIGESCFGYDLGVRIMTNLAKQEGMILKPRATDPRYTSAPVVGIGYKAGYPAWDDAFKKAEGDALALSRVTNTFAVYYFSNVPEKLMKVTGHDWEDMRGDPNMQTAMIGLTDYLWHAGRHSDGYYNAMQYVKKNDLDGAVEYLKKTAAYKQSGASRRQVLVDGLNAFNMYWNGTQR
nr:MAG TPA: hypothetical protein [Caudoviricetes sp.]